MIKTASVATVSIAALLLGGAPTWAQTQDEIETEDDYVYEIEVVAPRLTRILEERREGHRMVRVVERDAIVNFEDIDITQSAGMDELERRVTGAAREICDALAAEYPVGQPNPSECVRRAVNDAMAQAQDLREEATGF